MSKQFLTPRLIITGENAVADSADALAALGKRALIVTGKTVVTLDCFKTLTATLDKARIEYAVFDGITGEPTDDMIDEGAAVFKSNGCDFLIGIGGGSPLDSAKAIAVIAELGGKPADYLGVNITGVATPIAAIPTTAGTGSEATKFTVVTDRRTEVKMLLKGDCLIPDVAIIDPAFCATAPKSITASTGLDALTHAVEAYTSRAATPLTDDLAISAVKRLFTYLPRAYADGSDLEARTETAIAALEAGICINNSSVTIVHGMSRPIGALFHVPHGLSNAMLLEKCMAFAADGAVERFAALGRAVGVVGGDNAEIAAGFVAELGHICRICEVPTLAEYGIDRGEFFADIDKMSADAIASGSPANTRKPVTEADVAMLYASLWA